MIALSLSEAEAIANGALAAAKDRGMNPIAVAVLDGGGHLIVAKRQDGASYFWVDIATAKATAAVALAGPSRNFAQMAELRPQFAVSVVNISGGKMAPAAGGVPVVRDGIIVGSVGVGGDTSDNDEAAAIDGVHAAGLVEGS